MDRVLFGDNQFFGINHMSEEKARAQALRFPDTASMIRVLDAALDCGVRTFMCTTHDRIAGICDHVRADPERYRDFRIFPCLPYAHKYADAAVRLGPLGALRHFAPTSLPRTIARGAWAASRTDVIGIMKLLVDAELKMVRGLPVEVVFLQNITTDLLLGLGLEDMFVAFADHVRDGYGAEPGFITMNLPRLLPVLRASGIENPIVCSSVNKIGFRMCGGREVYERVIREETFRPIAMSVFASGAISPRPALEYVCAQDNIRSIVFGASTPEHIRQTCSLIAELSAD